MGSKTSEIPQFNDYLPTDRNVTIVEPFAGSAAVSYHCQILMENDYCVDV